MDEKSVTSNSNRIRSPKNVDKLKERFKSVADYLLLPDRVLRNVDIDKDGRIDGFEFDVRNPWYTAEPISAILAFHVIVDDQRIGAGKMSLLVRNQRIRVEDTASVTEVWWGFGEIISILVEKAGRLERGDHELECNLKFSPGLNYHGTGRNIPYSTKARMTVS